MTEASKLSPAPLDAYETAKPDEPIFRLQGGDPLAAPLVRIWAYLARVRAGLPGDVSMIDAPVFVAKTTAVTHDPKECENLLVRATAAEQISWHMDGYRRGEILSPTDVASVDELQKLDIFDIRRRMSSAIHNHKAQLLDYLDHLVALGFTENNVEADDKIAFTVSRAIRCLETLDELIEIRRER